MSVALRNEGIRAKVARVLGVSALEVMAPAQDANPLLRIMSETRLRWDHSLQLAQPPILGEKERTEPLQYVPGHPLGTVRRMVLAPALSIGSQAAVTRGPDAGPGKDVATLYRVMLPLDGRMQRTGPLRSKLPPLTKANATTWIKNLTYAEIVQARAVVRYLKDHVGNTIKITKELK